MHKKSETQNQKIFFHKFLLGRCGFFVSDVISGGLFGHLGPLCLALGAPMKISAKHFGLAVGP